MGINIEQFKKRLENEKKQIEESLSRLAKKNPNNPEDWEPVPAEMNVMVSDKNELADTFEEFENRAAIEMQLEEKLNKVKNALKSIKNGIYGTCETCKVKIEEKRLEAYPSARNCIKHAANY